MLWEDADEYRTLVAALVGEHAPHGPTEEHLVEELAGVLWRKRRLRLAEAAAHRRGLEGTLASFRETAMVALVHLEATDDIRCVRRRGADGFVHCEGFRTSAPARADPFVMGRHP